MPDSLPIARLNQAFVWTCEACGRDTFERAIGWDHPHDRTQEYADESGEWLLGPEEVTCPHCGTKHKAVDVAEE